MKIFEYIKKSYKNKFDTKRTSYFTKMFFIIVFICFALNLIGIGLSKYESNLTSKAKTTVAFFLIEEGTYEKNLPLGKITPSKDKYVYPFTISNHNDQRKTDVSIEYTVTFITTTNLPLKYSIYKNENYQTKNATDLIINKEIYQDENGVYYNNLIIDDVGNFTYSENQTDIFNLVVEFNEEYQNSPIDYSGYVDLVKVIVDAKQKMDVGE